MQTQAVLDDWAQNAKGHAAINGAFLRGLDYRADKAIDRMARRLHKEAFARLDCTRCSNCCKTMVPTFSDDEVQDVASHLRLDAEAVTSAYLVRSDDDDRFRPRSRPCPFLSAEGCCSIYEVRPSSCSDFPHTNRAHFADSADFHTENTLYCPAVFYVIEQMRIRGVR